MLFEIWKRFVEEFRNSHTSSMKNKPQKSQKMWNIDKTKTREIKSSQKIHW